MRISDGLGILLIEHSSEVPSYKHMQETLKDRPNLMVSSCICVASFRVEPKPTQLSHSVHYYGAF